MVAKPRKFQQRITISLTRQDHDRLEHAAKVEDVSLSQVVRRAVRDYLERHVQRELAFGPPADDHPTGRPPS